MPSESQSNILAGWAADLACPACHQSLRFDGPRIVCTSCGRIYPVIDGIPVLIADRADGVAQPDPKS